MELQLFIQRVYQIARKLIRFCFAHIELLLISGLIFVAAVQYYVRPQSQSFDQVVQTGKLRVLITDEPDSQFELIHNHYGFEYELLEAFAKGLGVELELEVVPYGELFSLLDSGAGDIAVGGILDSAFVRRVGQPTIPWYQAQTTIVYKRGTSRPKKLGDLTDESILASSRYYGIEQLQSLNLKDDHRSEYDLMAAVADGSERFVLSTNYRARNAKHYLPNLNRSFILPDTVGVVWVLPKRYDPKLLTKFNDFLQQSLNNNLIKSLAESYFNLPKRLTTFDALSVQKRIKTVLPNFEFEFRRAARRGDIDWHLLAAIAYQESRWSNDARSPTGVRGIMQLTNDTAKFLKVDDRLDMSQSIRGAARYISFLKSKLPKRIKEPDLTWFAVGAYNVGLKHILNAYKTAREEGLEHTEWSTISELLPNLYGAPFSQGQQAQTYVQRVQIFTDILRFYDLHQRTNLNLSDTITRVQTNDAANQDKSVP